MVKSDQFLEVCRRCGSKCCKMGGPTLTKKERDTILKAGHKDKFFPVAKGYYEIRCKKGLCAYLRKDDSCSIQRVKPLLCRCWPIFPEHVGRRRHFIMYQCPLAKILTKEQIDNCKREAKQVSKRFLSVALDYSTIPASEAKILERRFKRFKVRRL